MPTTIQRRVLILFRPATAGPQPPASPSGFLAIADPVDLNRIALSWTDNSDDEAGFEIRRSANGGSSWSTITTTAADAVDYADDGLLFGKRYDYGIRAVGAEASSAWSSNSFDTTGAPPPGNLSAAAVSSSRIDLSWDDGSSAQATTEIYRDSVLIDSVAAGVTTFSDTGLSASTTYEYEVVHVYPDVSSAPSGTASDTTDPGAMFDPGPYTWKYGDTISHNSNDAGYWSYGTEIVGFPTASGSYWFANCTDKDDEDRTAFLSQIDIGAVVTVESPTTTTGFTAEIFSEYQDPGLGGQGGWEIVDATGDFTDPDSDADIVITIVSLP